MIYQNVLEAMGHTPMIQLNKMADPEGARVLVKFEGLNVGGSIKTRTAYNMICKAEEDGILQPDSVIVEPTSGNQGIGLALVGAVKGYKTIIIINTTNRRFVCCCIKTSPLIYRFAYLELLRASCQL